LNAERMWYPLHGYDIQAMPTSRGMYGHGRALPPDWRDAEHAESCSRLLLTKAAGRMRRDRYFASKLSLWLDIRDSAWFGQRDIHCVQHDQACLTALAAVWRKAHAEISPRTDIIRVGVTLSELSPAGSRQMDMLVNDDAERQKFERITSVLDGLNSKFGKRVLTLGHWTPPPGGYAGGKIAYNRIPSAEGFW